MKLLLRHETQDFEELPFCPDVRNAFEILLYLKTKRGRSEWNAEIGRKHEHANLGGAAGWVCCAHSCVHYGNPDSGCGCQLILHWLASDGKNQQKEYTVCWRVQTMAAEIHSRPQTARPVLLNKIEGHSDAVNAAVLIPKEDGVITVSEDRWVFHPLAG